LSIAGILHGGFLLKVRERSDSELVYVVADPSLPSNDNRPAQVGICLSPAPQNGWETWFALEMGKIWQIWRCRMSFAKLEKKAAADLKDKEEVLAKTPGVFFGKAGSEVLHCS